MQPRRETQDTSPSRGARNVILWMQIIMATVTLASRGLASEVRLEVSQLYTGREAVAVIDCGVANARGVLLADPNPGPTDVPRVGQVFLGFSHELLDLQSFVTGPDGTAEVRVTVGQALEQVGRLWHIQAFVQTQSDHLEASNPVMRRVQAERSLNPPFPRLMTLGFQGHYWSQGAKYMIESEHNQVVLWRESYGNSHVTEAKKRYPGTYYVATWDEFLHGDPASGQNQSPDEFYLRDSKGQPLRIQFESQFLPNSSQFGAVVNGETAAEHMGRIFVERLDIANVPWDGLGHDWFWINMYEGDTDFNRNGINDAHEGLDKNFVHQQSQRSFLEALSGEFRRQSGKDPILYYNNGKLESWSNDLCSGAMAEGFQWGGHWSQVLRNERDWQDGRSSALDLGMMFTLKADGFRSGEMNFVPTDEDSTFHSDSAIVFNKNMQNNFQRLRFALTMTLLGSGYFTYDFFEHNLSWYYDEYAHSLGYPLSQPVQLRLGAQQKQVTSWTEDLGSVFVRFFEKGTVIHYAPPNEGVYEVEVTEQHLREAASRAGVPWSRVADAEGKVYRILGNQAPVIALSDDSSPTFQAGGSWASVQPSQWRSAQVGVWGGGARVRTPGSGSDPARWQVKVTTSDVYDVFATVAHTDGGLVSSALDPSRFGASTFASNARYRIQHDGGTTEREANLSQSYRSIHLGRFYFRDGENYSIELSDAADGLLYADSVYLQSVHAPYNDGRQFDSVALFGGPSSLDGIDSAIGYRNIVGDGIILTKAPAQHSIEPIIIGNYPVQDTWPGTPEAKYVGNWSDKSAVETGDARTENPYWATLTWNGFVGGAGSLFAFGYKEAQPNSGASAVYSPTIRNSGFYHVSEWHGFRGDRDTDLPEASNVPWSLSIDGEERGTGTLDQRTGKGQWNYLGTFWLRPGQKAELILSTDGADAPVISDAVRFEYVGTHR